MHHDIYIILLILKHNFASDYLMYFIHKIFNSIIYDLKHINWNKIAHEKTKMRSITLE
jgi:hypothetical protein